MLEDMNRPMETVYNVRVGCKGNFGTTYQRHKIPTKCNLYSGQNVYNTTCSYFKPQKLQLLVKLDVITDRISISAYYILFYYCLESIVFYYHSFSDFEGSIQRTLNSGNLHTIMWASVSEKFHLRSKDWFKYSKALLVLYFASYFAKTDEGFFFPIILNTKKKIKFFFQTKVLHFPRDICFCCVGMNKKCI